MFCLLQNASLFSLEVTSLPCLSYLLLVLDMCSTFVFWLLLDFFCGFVLELVQCICLE